MVEYGKRKLIRDMFNHFKRVKFKIGLFEMINGTTLLTEMCCGLLNYVGIMIREFNCNYETIAHMLLVN
jgi:hypothetical protein